jgi:carboxyl-terminal processing protease
MMGALGDPFTRFLSPEEWKKANEENSGTYSGIGAQLDRRKTKEGFILVSKPIPNSPAWKAGIKGGDLIVAVDGESVEKMDIDEAIRRIKGETGTKVRVTIRRDGQDKVYELTRAAVDYPIIETAMLPGKVGYIQLTSFNRLADQKLDASLAELEQHPDGPMKGLILDLRFNPGGLLDQAVDVGSRFVPEGPVMWRKLRQGEMRPEMANPKKRNHPRLPLVILVNGGSASASEIVAGAVKDAGTGVLVGERTYGKGLVQSLAPLRYGGRELAVAITTEHYYTRNKLDIDRQGVVPDVEVKTTDEDLKDLKNPSGPQLKRALEEVGKLIRKQNQ